MNNLDPIKLRNAFGKFMTGVTVVTTVDAKGTPLGFTANSFSSVSLDPPLLLVCPSKTMSSFDVFNRCENFHISVLAHDQQNVSNTFASPNDDRFSSVKWLPDELDCPAIEGAIASFTCKRKHSIDAGDHIIMLGQVIDFNTNDDHGLGYREGGYFSLEMERKATELQNRSQEHAETVVAGALLEHDNKLLLISDPNEDGTFMLPQMEISGEQASFDELGKYLSELLKIPVSVGSVFSIFDHENTDKTSVYYRVSIDQDEPTEMKGFDFVDLNNVKPTDFRSTSTAIMIERYLSEHKSGNHSIYIGSDTLGRTHKLSGARL